MMLVAIKVFSISIVGVLTGTLLGCGCLFSSTLHSRNPDPDLYKAWELQYNGKYRAAIAQCEQALEKFPHFPHGTKVINVSFPTFLQYYLAFCYIKLAETEGDVSFYSKAEAAAKQSYQTAIIATDQVNALYLWGYILFKQARYEEARAKFEALLERLQQSESEGDFTVDALFGLGKTLMGLGDTAAARRVFAQLEERIDALLPSYDRAEVLYPLGNVYLALGDETAARRVFAQLEGRIEEDLREFGYYFHGVDFYENTLYELGNIYLELGDTAAARRVFVQLLQHFPNSSHKPEIERLLEKP